MGFGAFNFEVLATVDLARGLDQVVEGFVVGGGLTPPHRLGNAGLSGRRTRTRPAEVRVRLCRPRGGRDGRTGRGGRKVFGPLYGRDCSVRRVPLR